MNFGLVGAHRVGKTTLAERVAQETEQPFLRSRVSHVFSKMGFRADQVLGWEDRMRVQWAILEEHKKLWGRAEGPFITDRTPVDFIGYMMCEAGPQAQECDEFRDYIEECYEALNFYFSGAMLIQPGIAMADPGEKITGGMTEIHVEQLNMIMAGAMFTCDEDVSDCRLFMLPREVTDLQDRIDLVVEKWSKSVTTAQKAATELSVH